MIELHALSTLYHADGHLDLPSFPTRRSSDLQNIQRRPPHSHRGDRGLDLVGFLIRMSGYKAKSTLCQDRKSTRLNSSHTYSSYTVHCGTKTKRQVGIIAKHQSRIAVGRRAHD